MFSEFAEDSDLHGIKQVTRSSNHTVSTVHSPSGKVLVRLHSARIICLPSYAVCTVR